MKIIITGATGLLGRAVYKQLTENTGYTVIGLGFSRVNAPLLKLNLRDKDDLTAFMKKENPDYIIHCAAERRPDVSEADPAASEQLNVEVTERGVDIYIQGKVIYDSGRAKIKKSFEPFLREVAEIIKRTDRMVYVEGHTDDIPIHTPRFPSNWELSTQRAVNVVKFFIEKCGVDPSKLAAAGYAQYHPRFLPMELHRAENRRVEIIISRQPWRKGGSFTEKSFPSSTLP